MKSKHDRSDQTRDIRKITDFFCPNSPSDRINAVSERIPSASVPETREVHQRENSPHRRRSGRLPHPTEKAKPNRIAPSKRTRSPEPLSPQRKKGSANKERSGGAKRQKKFESDLDPCMDDVGPLIPVKPQKQCEHVENDSKNEKTKGRFESIPTSQSDEMELDELPRLLEADRARIEDPNIQSLPSSLASVSSTPNSILSDPSDSTNANCSRFTPDTPPVSEHLRALPLSPVALDENTKTAQLIEKIKAEAQTKVQQLHDSPPPQFNDILDSSSDEGETLFTVPVEAHRKGRSGEPDQERPRAFRDSGKSPRSLSPSIKRKLLLSKETNVGTNSIKRISKPFNPLDALLSEKRSSEKAGRDTQAFFRAESTLRLKDTFDQDDFDIYTSERWLDEVAAQNVVREVQTTDFRETEMLDVSLDADHAVKLIGANGMKVADILKRDRAHEEQDADTFSACGLRLWMVSLHCRGERPVQVCRNYSFLYCGVNPIVNLLKVALEQQDFLQANLILESGVLSNVDLNNCEDLLSFLCKQAFSYPPCAIQVQAYITLLSVYTKQSSDAPSFVMAWLLDTFAVLGAEASVLELMGYDRCNVGEDIQIDIHYRDDAMLRMVYLLQTAGQSQRVAIYDIPDFIVAMQRVALDPTTSSELRIAVIRLLDILCNSASPDIERLICEKAISFSVALEMPYRTQFASMFSSGSGTTRRIARWVAYAMLMGQAFPPEGDVPPLRKLLHTVEAGSVFQTKDDGDYAMLWYSVQLLSIVLTDVGLYDAAERGASQSQDEQAVQVGSPNKRKNRSMILLLHESLERLHAEIQDTRALHLDRSRAKAAIKQLSLRLRYQHSDTSHIFQSGIPRRKTLDHFFTPKKSQ